MKRSFIIFAVTVGLLMPGAVWAQDAETPLLTSQDAKSLSNREWRQTISAIKSDTQVLLQKNKELETEYEFLQEKLSVIQSSLEELRQDIRKQEATNDSLKKTQAQKTRASSTMKEQNDRIQEEISVLETRNQAMKSELDAKRQETEALQDRLAELKKKKRQLTLDLKLKEFTKEDLELEQNQALEDIKLQLKGYQKQEEDLFEVREKVAEQKEELALDVEKIKDQTRQLEEKLAKLRQDKFEKERQVASSQRENQRLDATLDDLPAGLLKEKRVLESEISRSESQIEDIRSSLQKSQHLLNKKRELMDEIMRMDAENQSLRQTAADLMQTLSGFQGDLDGNLPADTKPQPSLQ